MNNNNIILHNLFVHETGGYNMRVIVVILWCNTKNIFNKFSRDGLNKKSTHEKCHDFLLIDKMTLFIFITCIYLFII